MARYRDAVLWISRDLNGEFLDEDDQYVAIIRLAAHLFGKDERTVAEAVWKCRQLEQRRHERRIRDEEEEESRMMEELA